MELRHLRYFRMVAEELNFRRAAERLFMEPQPLHFQIRQLERELGFQLLTQRDGRTQLTPAGEEFRREADAVLAAADQAVARAARVARGEVGTLRIGFPTSLVNPLLAASLQRFRGTYPDASFQVRYMPFSKQLEALERAQIDLGLGATPAGDDARFSARPLTRARPLVAVSAADELAALKAVPWTALDGRAAALFEPNASPSARSWIDAMLAGHGVTVREVQTVDDTETAIAAAALGIGIAFVLAPPAMLPERDDVAFVELPPNAGEMEISALWPRGQDNPLRDKFVDVLVAAAAELKIAAPDDLPPA